MALLYDLGIFSIVGTDNALGVGWKLWFYTTGTTSLRNTYPTNADAIAGTNANTNPVVADAGGRFAPIWLVDANYKVVLTDQYNVPKVTRDPCTTASGGSGTVTSVSLSMPGIFTVSGSPVTTTGALTATLASQSANLFWGAPNGSAGAPTFRALATADLPKVAVSVVSTSFSAADTDDNMHKVAAGAAQTLTLGSLTTGVSFTLRFTTAWLVACAGGLSKNGASPTAVTTGSIAANSIITFLHEGAGVWLASGSGLT